MGPLPLSPTFWILATEYDKADDPRRETPGFVGGDAFINDELQLQIGSDGGLKGTVALIRFLHHGSCVGNAGVKDEPVEAEVGEEGRIEYSRAAVAFDDDPPSFSWCRVQK